MADPSRRPPPPPPPHPLELDDRGGSQPHSRPSASPVHALDLPSFPLPLSPQHRPSNAEASPSTPANSASLNGGYHMRSASSDPLAASALQQQSPFHGSLNNNNFSRHDSAPIPSIKSISGSPTAHARMSSSSVLRRGSGLFPDDVSAAPSRGISFQKGRAVGSGGFGTVYQAVLSTGVLAAVKELKLDKSSVKAIDREVHIMSGLPAHPNCVRYFGSRNSTRRYYIIMEYISGGSIASLRQSVGAFKESVFQRYAYMTLLGLDHLHRHGIIHRDIKGANVLLDERGSAKIVDFGCCKDLNQTTTTVTGGGTPLWMAPEVCRGEPANEKSDVWAFGCLCLEMTNDTGLPWTFPPTMNLQGIAYALACATEPPPIPKHLTELAQDFIASCLRIDPDQRLSVTELLEHPFFDQDYYDDSDEEDLMASRGTPGLSTVKQMAVDGDIHVDPSKGIAGDNEESVVALRRRPSDHAGPLQVPPLSQAWQMRTTNAGFHLDAVDDDSDSGAEGGGPAAAAAAERGKRTARPSMSQQPDLTVHSGQPAWQMQTANAGFQMSAVDDDDDDESDGGSHTRNVGGGRSGNDLARHNMRNLAVSKEDDTQGHTPTPHEAPHASAAADDYDAQIDDIIAIARQSKQTEGQERGSRPSPGPPRPAHATAGDDHRATRSDSSSSSDDDAAEGSSATGSSDRLGSEGPQTPERHMPRGAHDANRIASRAVYARRIASANESDAGSEAPAAVIKPSRRASLTAPASDERIPTPATATDEDPNALAASALQAPSVSHARAAEPEEFVWMTGGTGHVEGRRDSVAAREVEDLLGWRRTQPLSSVEERRPSTNHPKRAGLNRLLGRK